ncbi:guanosine polyphosphate pyrophosphohydrolase/synthetase [Rickettsia massiliae str. AZT80]|uniref:Guanosine polyphosphate pyrophosphohydrolase/synthetase n=2 Tax=spotted fever group TaxID=114277 RepID=H6QI55_RICMA|nr:guanosine polyphosphate pyrophosphohydrolase/synthetase [Rickettsia massiliae str. AZT80]
MVHKCVSQGDPYYSYPIEVAIMLAEFVADEALKLFTSNMINAALLHYTIEDTELTEKISIEIFGKETAKHVEGVTRELNLTEKSVSRKA